MFRLQQFAIKTSFWVSPYLQNFFYLGWDIVLNLVSIFLVLSSFWINLFLITSFLSCPKMIFSVSSKKIKTSIQKLTDVPFCKIKLNPLPIFWSSNFFWWLVNDMLWLTDCTNNKEWYKLENTLKIYHNAKDSMGDNQV